MVVGREVEGYQIQEVLGQGGMGVVYKARDLALSRTVAIKRIAPSFANDKSFLRRFRSEAQALARIDSPYIVRVHALLETEIGLLLVMEYVDGGTLRDVIDEGPMNWRKASPLVKQTLQALEDAHGENVIHRDIKPSNIMLTADGSVKVTDFGLAKVHHGDSRATVTQGVHGTLNYMSPEQVRGGANLDHRSDLYSLAMTVFELLAGELPFEKDSGDFSKMRMIVEEELPEPRALRPEVPDGVSEVVMTALEKDPNDRFQSAREMRVALDAVGPAEDTTSPATGADAPVLATPSAVEPARIRVAGIGLLIVLLTVGGYMMYDMMNGDGNGSHSTEDPGALPSVSGTPLSVATRPTGASVYLGERHIGTTPLRDTLEGDTAAVRVQKAGYAPLDTSITLGTKQQVGLHLTLTKDDSETDVAVRTEPPGATVYVDDDSIGVSPLQSTTEKATANITVEKDGYVPVDTTLQLTDVGRADLGLQLTETERETRRSPHGTYHLRAAPTGTVIVDGQEYGSTTEVELPVGDHEVRFRHPEYGSMDTTLTVQDEQTQELTCHFEQTIQVRSPDHQGRVFLDGTNAGASTPYTLSRGPGTYRVELRLPPDAPFTIPGGSYARKDDGRQNARVEFSGHVREITIEPSCAAARHIVTFRTQSFTEQVRSKTAELKREIKQAIQEQDWHVLPPPLAKSCKEALSALYSKHEIQTVDVVSQEMQQDGTTITLPFDIYITYHQKGRDGTKAIPLSLITQWENQGDTMVLVNSRRTHVDRN